MLHTPLKWIVDNYIEILGAVTGMVYIYFSIRRIIWLWPLGIITSAFYVFIFFDSRFYADMGLQVYYFAISIYGWRTWKTIKEDEGKIPVKRIAFYQLIMFLFYTIILTFIISLILINYTDSPLPVWDAFTTAGSILATYMLAKRYIENWLFWIVIDVISIGLYLYRGLYPTVVLFAVYSVMAVVGYYKWKENLIRNA
jgi:nicotinamide mononucleotide transporter